MGCDGGTIPKRDELVRTKQKKEVTDKSTELSAKWQFCAISSNRLVEPIVSCELGRLYNKDAVIEYLLDKTSTPNVSLVEHIRSLKDVVPLNLTVKTDFSDKKPEIDGQYVDTQDSPFICPVVGIEMNGLSFVLHLFYINFIKFNIILGKYKFCYIRSCGCVLSERALKEVKSDNCHKCNKEFSSEDIVVLNGTEEEVKQMRKRMEERRTKLNESKKNKKRKATETVVSSEPKEKSTKEECLASTSGSSSSKTTAISSKTSTKPLDKSSKEYSVAKDPNVSETYKSLFTSHQSAKDKPSPHWITFNPCYY